MTEKRQIIEKLVPVAVLRAVTPNARNAVPQTTLVDDLVPIRNFPFRVGRESRVKIIDGRVERIEREKPGGSTPNNDLYLVDDGRLLNISREHFQLERNGGKYYLYDRGSACDTLVGERMVGGDDREETVEIGDGDLITWEPPSLPMFSSLSPLTVLPWWRRACNRDGVFRLIQLSWALFSTTLRGVNH